MAKNTLIKQKHVDMARELRLWIRDVIAPVGLIAAVVLNDTNILHKPIDKLRTSNKAERKFKNDCSEKVDELLKRGTEKHSGRYPWGSTNEESLIFLDAAARFKHLENKSKELSNRL